MSNVLSTEKREQVVALGRLGWPLRRIEQTTGVRRETASAYLRAAGIPIRPPGSWGRRPAKPANEVTTDPEAENPVSAESSAPPPSPPSGSSCEPYRETIQQALERGRNAMAIWQDLVTDHGFAGSYESVKRFVRKLRGVRSPEAVGIIQTGAGEEAQVDYGTGPMVRDPKTGKYRRTRLFVMTLGYSRKSVRLLTFKSSSRIWAQLHETAFRRLGGTPRLIVLDNLREGVIVPDHYDPTLNPLFRDVLTHYGVVAMPCRVRDPDRKGKVESGVGHAQKTPLKGQRFESLDQAQGYLDRWEVRWADTRIHPTTKRQVAPCSPKRNHLLSRCRSNRFAITNSVNVSSISTVASKSKPPITVYRRAGSDGVSRSSGTRFTSGSWTQTPINSSASMSARSGVDTVSVLKTTRRKPR